MAQGHHGPADAHGEAHAEEGHGETHGEGEPHGNGDAHGEQGHDDPGHKLTDYSATRYDPSGAPGKHQAGKSVKFDKDDWPIYDHTVGKVDAVAKDIKNANKDHRDSYVERDLTLAARIAEYAKDLHASQREPKPVDYLDNLITKVIGKSPGILKAVLKPIQGFYRKQLGAYSQPSKIGAMYPNSEQTNVIMYTDHKDDTIGIIKLGPQVVGTLRKYLGVSFDRIYFYEMDHENLHRYYGKNADELEIRQEQVSEYELKLNSTNLSKDRRAMYEDLLRIARAVVYGLDGSPGPLRTHVDKPIYGGELEKADEFNVPGDGSPHLAAHQAYRSKLNHEFHLTGHYQNPNKLGEAHRTHDRVYRGTHATPKSSGDKGRQTTDHQSAKYAGQTARSEKAKATDTSKK